jgi:hypothetical protein
MLRRTNPLPRHFAMVPNPTYPFAESTTILIARRMRQVATNRRKASTCSVSPDVIESILSFQDASLKPPSGISDRGNGETPTTFSSSS